MEAKNQHDSERSKIMNPYENHVAPKLWLNRSPTHRCPGNTLSPRIRKGFGCPKRRPGDTCAVLDPEFQTSLFCGCTFGAGETAIHMWKHNGDWNCCSSKTTAFTLQTSKDFTNFWLWHCQTNVSNQAAGLTKVNYQIIILQPEQFILGFSVFMHLEGFEVHIYNS